MTNLDLVETQDLLIELKKRHDAIVFLGLKNGLYKEEDGFMGQYDGGTHICLGMIVDAANKLKQGIINFYAQEEEESPGN